MIQSQERDARRILALLVRGAATMRPAADERLVLLDIGDGAPVAVAPSAIEALAGCGSIERKGATVTLKKETVTLKKENGGASADAFPNRPGGGEESPLAGLARHKDRRGRPFLTPAEFRSGERLRADFTRAQMMPRLGASWEMAISTGRRGAPGTGVEISHSALAARQRVTHALEAVGPELAGVLVDICCFLKGFSLVETERAWPVRSAKIVLKTGLAALARHYEPEKATRPAMRHWGVADYRPRLDGSGSG